MIQKSRPSWDLDPVGSPVTRLFNKRHGWQIKGLETAGGAVRSDIRVGHYCRYPLVISYIAIENGHRNSGFIHEKWGFSIAMLNYQRVDVDEGNLVRFNQQKQKKPPTG